MADFDEDLGEEKGDGAAPELVMKYTEELQQKGFQPVALLKLAQTVEEALARIVVLSNAVNDGSIYTPEIDPETKQPKLIKKCESSHDYALMLFVLKNIEKAAAFMLKSAKKATNGSDEKNGEDGHAGRFAELLVEEQQRSVKFEDIPGGFFIKSPIKAMGPWKGHEDFQEFDKWLEDNRCKVNMMNWQRFQKEANHQHELGILPSFITIKPRQVVQFRKG